MTPAATGVIAELREDACVTLAPDGAAFGLDCRVVGFHRQLMVLERSGATDGREVEGLTPGALSYVVCGSRKRPMAVRVQVMSAVDDRLVLRLLDRFTLGQQRTFSRLRASWPITLDAGQGPVDSWTIDVSAGGALVRARDGLRGHGAFAVVLRLPGDRPPLHATARVVRGDDRDIALRFVDLDDADEARVAEVVLEALGAGGDRTTASFVDAVDAAIAGR